MEHDRVGQTVRVFVVGRTVVFAEILAESLTGSGFRVVATSLDLTKVPSQISGLEIDVVVIEAGDDYIDELRATRSIKDTCPSCEIVLFGLQRHRDAVDFAAAGASGYVLRSESFKHLTKTVRSAYKKETLCSPGVIEQVLARIRDFPPGKTERLNNEPQRDLTKREANVLELMAQGRFNKEIARELGISLPTVKNHVHSILTKLGAKNRRQASLLASLPPND